MTRYLPLLVALLLTASYAVAQVDLGDGMTMEPSVVIRTKTYNINASDGTTVWRGEAVVGEDDSLVSVRFERLSDGRAWSYTTPRTTPEILRLHARALEAINAEHFPEGPGD